MRRYLFDSNVLFHLVNKAAGFELIEQRMRETPVGGIVVSAVTVWEIVRRAEHGQRPIPQAQVGRAGHRPGAPGAR